MKLHIVHSGLFKLDGGAMFGVVPKTMWQKINAPDEKNLCTWAMRCLLVEYDDRLVLIDTGLGDKQSDKFFSYYEPHGEDSLEGGLKKLGFTPDDITDVFHTHLHFDHCGGTIRYEGEELIPTFKNAAFWSNKAHWEWATKPNPREKASFLKENILPMQESGRLELLDTDEGMEVFPGFKLRFVYGHTEAMMIPQLEYNGKTIIHMADLLPSVGHIPLPYVMAYDVRPLQTMKEKAAFLEEAAAREYILFFEHDRENECCTLQHTEKGVRVKDTFKLSEVL